MNVIVILTELRSDSPSLLLLEAKNKTSTHSGAGYFTMVVNTEITGDTFETEKV